MGVQVPPALLHTPPGCVRMYVQQCTAVRLRNRARHGHDPGSGEDYDGRRGLHRHA
ncbi:hypothetical protein SGPA1_12557 [Streptomyces misionensis JCM 4497]